MCPAIASTELGALTKRHKYIFSWVSFTFCHVALRSLFAHTIARYHFLKSLNFHLLASSSSLLLCSDVFLPPQSHLRWRKCWIRSLTKIVVLSCWIGAFMPWLHIFAKGSFAYIIMLFMELQLHCICMFYVLLELCLLRGFVLLSCIDDVAAIQTNCWDKWKRREILNMK